MLKNTFIHMPGIGGVTEQRLWDSGITDWDAPLKVTPGSISAGRKNILTKGIEESRRHFEMGNPAFFSNNLPSNQSWRLFSEFRESTVYLDIETTGLEATSTITTIALYDGVATRYYVQGKNLNAFLKDIQQYQITTIALV